MTARILTVDDSRTMRDMLAFTPKIAGYEVLQAKNGQNALNLTTERADAMKVRGRALGVVGQVSH